MTDLPTRLTEAADELLLIGPLSDAERDTFANAAALLREAAAALDDGEKYVPAKQYHDMRAWLIERAEVAEQERDALRAALESIRDLADAALAAMDERDAMAKVVEAARAFDKAEQHGRDVVAADPFERYAELLGRTP